MTTVWIFNHYAEGPDGQATRTFDLSKRLVRSGHRVTIFASSFSHYKLQETRLRSGQLFTDEVIDGVHFRWLRTVAYTRNDLRRVLNVASYGISAFFSGLLTRERPDIVIGVSVHPLAALVAWIVARVKRAKFYVEITDLWPEVLIQMDLLNRSHPPAVILAWVERFLYARAVRIFMLWPFCADHVARSGTSRDKVVWLPHVVDLQRYDGFGEYSGEVSNENFSIYYIGGHTTEYGLDVIIEAAAILMPEMPTVRFVFIGGGTDKERLLRKARELDLNNVEFRDPVPKEDIGATLWHADAFVFSRKRLPLFESYGISNNKLCDYLAAGRPILYTCRARNNPVEEAGAGLTIEPGDAAALAKAVRRLVQITPAQRLQMGLNGKRYARANHDADVLAGRLADSLEISR